MIKKTTATILLGASLIAGGGAVTDAQINPYTDTGTAYEMKVDGENVILAKDSPTFTLEKWNGENAITVKREGDYKTSERAVFSDVRTIESVDSKETVVVEPVEGGTKIDLILNEHPDTNIFNFTIDGSSAFDFFYQPPLTEETLSNTEQKKLDHCTETDCIDTEGVTFIHRPEEIVGSYAVYHKTKKDNKYQTGKAFHIYRPKIIDAKGNTIWGQLSFENGVLSVTIPQEFIDSAVYPVRIDPTLGYTTIGGTASAFASYIHCTQFTSTEAGTVTKMTTYGTGSPNPQAMGAALYGDTSAHPGAKLAEDSGNASVGNGAAAWYDNNISLAITNATIYWLCQWQDNSINYYYDAAASGKSMDKGGHTFETWPNPITANEDVYSRVWSTYITYTASGGGAVTTSRLNINSRINVNSKINIQ